MIPMRPVAEAACKAVSFSWRDERGRNRKCGASTATVTSETKALGNRHGMAETSCRCKCGTGRRLQVGVMGESGACQSIVHRGAATTRPQECQTRRPGPGTDTSTFLPLLISSHFA